MILRPEKLLVLKAYYLGHGISQNRTGLPIARQWIDRAIDAFKGHETDEDCLRLFFYTLLKAEVLRGSEAVVEARRFAKEVSSRIDPGLFDLYMKIEDATQTRSRALGLESGYIGNDGIQTIKKYAVQEDRFKSTWVEFDAVLQAAGVEFSDLSRSDGAFLYEVTLKQILEKHGVHID